MRVLDLFAGKGGWSAAFRRRGHEVVTVDLDPRFGTTIVADLLTLDPDEISGPWDIILASPPCESFSTLAMWRNWDGLTPKTDAARISVQLVERTLWLIDRLQPRAWIIENPRAKLRVLPLMRGIERRTVTYCQYGLFYQKPTDLWGGFPPTLRLHPQCGPRDPCHEHCPRGQRAGLLAVSSVADRAEIPYPLSLAVCLAMENWRPDADEGAAIEA